MTNPVRINASTLNRPGVFVTQASTGGLPQPIASHAVGYIFGTTPVDDYYGSSAIDAYSSFEPYSPTQVGSVADYLERVGGSVPVGNKGALATYDGIKAFFDNVGVNGILYFTRVAPTPETVLDLSASSAGAGYNAFALKINGRYFGTSIGVNDADGTDIKVITTTALNQADNARDIYEFLASNGDGFTDYYRIEQSADEAVAGKFRIYSRDPRSLPRVDRFFAYNFSDTSYASPVNLDTQDIVKFYTSVKEINFRCVSREVETGESILPISGSQLSSFLEEKSTTYSAPVANFDDTADTITLTDSTGLADNDMVVLETTAAGTLSLSLNTIYYVVNKTGDAIQVATTSGGSAVDFTGAPGAAVTVRKVAYDPSTAQSAIIKDFIVDQAIYATASDIPDDKVVAVSKDLTTGNTAPLLWPAASAAYWRWDLGTTTFAKIQDGGNDAVPSGTITTSGGITTRTGYVPDSVQVFYVNIAGENRAIIANGSTPDELTTEVANEIRSILQEKELDDYYTVEAVASSTNVSGDTYVPNNGHQVALLTSDAGTPYTRPEIEDIALTGTITVSSGVVSGTNTLFETELAIGDVFVANGIRYTVTGITDNDTAAVTPNTIDISTATSFALDKSIPNGFDSYEYVLKVKITSNNGVSSPVNPGANRFGIVDANVVKLVSTDQNAGYDSYKLASDAKAQDFVYAIEQGMDSKILSPGFLLAPEAYTVLAYEAGADDSVLGSKTAARAERLKVTQALVRAAEGKLGPTEGITGTQHLALIDCGADETSLTQVQDELALIKATVGVPFGHAAYYAPYIKNLDDRFIAPSSYVAGIACSRYINEGFQQPPAGARYPLRGAVDLRFDISAQQQEVTYALGLNPIRSLPNRGIVAWGARTLSSNALFKYVNTRAILNVLLDVMARSFDDILFEQIDSAGTVYARVKSIASQICGQFFRQGALFGSRPEQAYLVVCSDVNNNPNDLEAGSVRLDVYVATSPTLERLLVTIVRTPAGQVAQLSDSFSRNEERFQYLLNTTSNFV